MPKNGVEKGGMREKSVGTTALESYELANLTYQNKCAESKFRIYTFLV